MQSTVDRILSRFATRHGLALATVKASPRLIARAENEARDRAAGRAIRARRDAIRARELVTA